MAANQKSPHRIEHGLNKKLGEVIPVVYGAVLSYAMWIFAQLVVGIWNRYGASSDDAAKLNTKEFLIRLIVFVGVMTFLVEDIGEIIKIADRFPYKRSSRYSHEIVIACLYVLSLSLIGVGSFLAITAFGLAVFWGGLWSNQLKEEYKDEPICHFARTQRTLLYLGGCLIIAESASFIVFYHDLTLDRWVPLLVTSATFLIWSFMYVTLLAYFHGSQAHEYTLNCIWPDRFVVSNNTELLTSEAQRGKEEK